MFITKITFSKAAEFFTIILFSVAENVPITASQRQDTRQSWNGITHFMQHLPQKRRNV